MALRHTSAEHVQLFITYLSRFRHLSTSSIRCYISGISFYFKLHYNINPAHSFGITMLLKSYEKNSKTQLVRKPIDLHLLGNLIESVNAGRLCKYDRLCYIILYSLMYHGALRVSEICFSNTADHIIQFNNVCFSKSNSTIKLKLCSFKHSNGSTPTIVISCNNILSKSINSFLSRRGSKPGPFICHKSSKPFSRLEFVIQLKTDLKFLKYDPDHYNSHSFRIGKATDMAKAGASDSQIALMGRWRSNAFKQYIRPNLIFS